MRRFRGRRRFSKPVKRVQNAWSPFVFDQTAGDATGTPVVFALFDPISSDPASVTDNNVPTRVRRIICSGGYQLLPDNSATPLVDNSGLHMAVGIMDTDDNTDGSLVTTATSSFLTSHRILWRQAIPFVVTQVNLPESQPGLFDYTVPVNFDIKCNVKLRPDELIVLILQFASNSTGVLDDFPRFTAQGAVLFEPN